MDIESLERTAAAIRNSRDELPLQLAWALTPYFEENDYYLVREFINQTDNYITASNSIIYGSQNLRQAINPNTDFREFPHGIDPENGTSEFNEISFRYGDDSSELLTISNEVMQYLRQATDETTALIDSLVQKIGQDIYQDEEVGDDYPS